jgi:hypothetical protein
LRIPRALNTALTRSARIARTEWPGLLVSIGSGAAVLLWFARGNLVLFIDGFLPFYPIDNLGQLAGAWSDYNGIGTLNVTNIPLTPVIATFAALSSGFGLPLNVVQGLIFGAVEVIAASFMYGFVRRCTFNDPTTARIAAVSAASFYAANPVFLVLYWYLNFPGSAGIFAAAPAIAYFLQRGLKRADSGSFDLVSLLALAVFSIIAAVSGVPYVLSSAIIVAVLIIALLPLSNVVSKAHRKLRLWFILAFGLVVALANAFWLLPEMASVGYVGALATYGPSAASADLAYNSSSASPFAIATYQYFPAWNHWGLWASIYTTSVVFDVLLPSLILGVIAAALLAAKTPNQAYSNSFFPLLCALVFVVLVFALSGSNVDSPFAPLYVGALQSNGVLASFLRGPYLTFGPAYAFVGSILFGSGTGVLARRGQSFLSKRNTPADSAVALSFAPPHRKMRAAVIAIPVVLIVVCSGIFAFPIWTGQTVSDLQYPATPVVPSSTYSTASFLRANLGESSAIVLPATTGYVLENWSNPYLGPPVLPYAGASVLESVIPTLGSSPNFIIPMTFALPSYNSSPTYGHLLQLLGEKYALIDDDAGFNSLTLTSNMTAIRSTLAHADNVTFLQDNGGYTIYQVSNSSSRVMAAQRVVPDNLTADQQIDLSQEYADLANNSTDLSHLGLWSSTAQIAQSQTAGFNISAYWPSPSIRSTRGTGFHFPGWAEVTNLQPLNISVGRYPLVYVWVKPVSNQVVPVIWFSAVPTVREYIGNITAYDRTLNQFFLLSPIQTETEGNGTLYIYNLATQGGVSTLVGGLLNHVMIELQPVGSYYGSLNASVRIGIGSPPFLDTDFNPTTTAIVSQSAYNLAQEAVNEAAPQVSFKEIDPSDYVVSVAGAHHQFVLIFLQTYDGHWQLSLPTGDSAMHFIAQDFANGWVVNVTQSSLSITLSFALETYVTVGWATTLSSFIALPILMVAQRTGVYNRLRSAASKYWP